MRGSGRFLKFAAAGLGISVAGFTVVNCSTAWTNTNHYNIPEGFPKWDYNWDRREPYALVKKSRRGDKADSTTPPDLEKHKATATRHLIFIRHGQYNLDGKTDAERTLTPLGKLQAAATGKRLKELDFNFNSLIVSNMSRALETSEIIGKEIFASGCSQPFEADPMLREGPPAPPDPPVSHWKPDLYYYQEGPRIEAAFRKYIHRADPEQKEDSYELIVCHANVIRYFICRAMQFPGEAWLRITLHNGSITRLSVLPSGRVILRAVNESGHMPPDLLTST